MPFVTFLPVEVTAEVAPGSSLLDAGEAAGIEMEAGCFNCSCGTCIVEIVRGAENLDPPSPDEVEVLDQWSRDPEKYRCACSARVRTGEIVIRQLD
ncbi:MAG TPA: 2Fe-2S iron-sulfur cluster-binding protein [Verrucomicrobiota bacterium]|nr:2Fe-2S iron-sulfur cluster-binding protein [Verrucomicrobiota bacterium]HNU51557.1 2Fe-2S iron-sulfur cluster-binding protein [Verrucomicrobiota bacterium]